VESEDRLPQLRRVVALLKIGVGKTRLLEAEPFQYNSGPGNQRKRLVYIQARNGIKTAIGEYERLRATDGLGPQLKLFL